tara:strand:- start:2272 stop:4128 length:1857 start_codon:yes stop_codon:yes gene_type:complete
MPIVVDHGPSMVPVGRLAFATGQAEYINKRRRELEEQAMRERQMRQQENLQNQRLAAGFKQAQFNHMAGMQKEFVKNQFLADRDQKIQDWEVQNNLVEFGQKQDLAEQAGQRQLDWLAQQDQLMDDRQAQQHKVAVMDQVLNRTYKRANQMGRDKIDEMLGQLAEAKDSGEVSTEQYNQKRSEIYQQIAEMFTGEDSAMYKIGAEDLPGGEKIILGGAYKEIVQQDGSKIRVPNFDDGQGGNMDRGAYREKYTIKYKLGNNEYADIPDMMGGFNTVPIQTEKSIMDAMKLQFSNDAAQQKMAQDMKKTAWEREKDKQDKFTETMTNLMNSGYNADEAAGIIQSRFPFLLPGAGGAMIGTPAERARAGLGGGGNVMSAGESFDAAMGPAQAGGVNRIGIPRTAAQGYQIGAPTQEERAASIPDAKPTQGWMDQNALARRGDAGRGSEMNPIPVKSQAEIEQIQNEGGGFVKMVAPGHPANGKMIRVAAKQSNQIPHYSMVKQQVAGLDPSVPSIAHNISQNLFAGQVSPQEIQRMSQGDIVKRAVQLNYAAHQGRVRTDDGNVVTVGSQRGVVPQERDPHGRTDAMRREEERRLREQMSNTRTVLPNARSGWQSDVFGL